MWSILFSSIESVLNYYLQLDPETTMRLAKLAGKVVAIKDSRLNFECYLIFTPEKIKLQRHYQGIADTTLQGTPFALSKLFNLFSSRQQAIFSGEITISGDMELGQAVQTIFDNIDVDWEEQLSKLTGDVIAHQVGNRIRGLQNFLSTSKTSFQQNLSEYLQEEIGYLPPRLELEDFLQDVSLIRDDIERMEARVQRIVADQM